MCKIFSNIYNCFYDLFCRFDELDDDDILSNTKTYYYGELSGYDNNNFFIITRD